MNLPELLGAAGARTAPRLPDSGVKSVDDGDSDAFMASVISAGRDSDGGTTDEAQIGQDELARGEDRPAKSCPNRGDADGSAETEAAGEDTAAGTPDDVQSGRDGDPIETPQLLTKVDPEALTIQTKPAEPSVAIPVGTAEIRSGDGVTTPGVTTRDAPGLREVVPETGAKSPDIQLGDKGPSAQTVAPARATTDQIAVNASGQAGKAQTPEPQGVSITAAVAQTQAPARQTPIQTTRDKTQADAATRSSETGLHAPREEIDSGAAEAVAERRLDLRREVREPAARMSIRDESGARAPAFRATATSQPQNFLSQSDGIVTPGTSGQPASSAQSPISRDAVPEARIAGAVNGSDGTGKSVAQQISAALRHQPLLQKIDLSLDPPELGRIEIQMEVAESGMRATLAAERVATSEIIRRQAEVLVQQLDDAGFDNVSLDFRDFGSGGGEKQSQEPEPNMSGSTVVRDSVPDRPSPTHRRSPADAGMDIRL